MNKDSLWFKVIPWYMTVISTACLTLVSIYLYYNTEWFKLSALDNSDLMKDPQYRIFVYSTYLSMVKRSLGIITGIAIVFIGLAVSFYELNKDSSVDLKGLGKLASASPGLISILLGCYLISQSIQSKDTIKFNQKSEQKSNNSQSE